MKDWKSSVPGFVFWGLVLLGFVQIGIYYPSLPDKMASHFNGQGNPNGWSSKTGMMILQIGTLCVLAICFYGIRLLIPRMPDSLINLPHKDYWLSPERRDATQAFIAYHYLWFGNATMVLMLMVFQDVIRANQHDSPRMSAGMPYVLVAYIIYTIIFVIYFVGHFVWGVSREKG